MKTLILGARRRAYRLFAKLIGKFINGTRATEQEQPHEDSRSDSRMSGFQRNVDRSPQTATALNCSETPQPRAED
jgi:hypothetical protein